MISANLHDTRLYTLNRQMVYGLLALQQMCFWQIRMGKRSA